MQGLLFQALAVSNAFSHVLSKASEKLSLYAQITHVTERSLIEF